MSQGLFYNKTLLVLGSNTGFEDIVNYARGNGAYTIVADYYPVERSSAKRVADENVMISTADVDALGKLIEERHVDGVLAGISEFNLLKAMSLAEKFEMPFYCSRKQWDQIENKAEFRKLCEGNHVPCPYTYFTGSKLTKEVIQTIQYPVVIKPVDNSSSTGVHICENEQELLSAEPDSHACSASGVILVEKFVKGQEFTAHYTINNGTVTLSCIDNRYPISLHEGNVTTIPVARVYPSVFLDEYLEQVNTSMLQLCQNIGLTDAVLFVQGIYDPEEGFNIFEGGLRPAGEAAYRILDKINDVNFMHLLTEHALLGRSVTFDSTKEDPNMKGKCCGVVSFVAQGGTVGKITGLEESVKNTPSVIEYENRYPVGSKTPDGDTLRQLMIRFVLICNSREQLVKDVAFLNEHIKVLNTDGEEMIVKIEPDELLNTQWGGVISRYIEPDLSWIYMALYLCSVTFFKKGGCV